MRASRTQKPFTIKPVLFSGTQKAAAQKAAVQEAETMRNAIKNQHQTAAERRFKKHEHGFTLIEVLGALVVGSLVFSFAAFAISKAIESARVSSFTENLALLRINVHEVYASSNGFGSSSTASVDITDKLVDAGAIPQPWLDKDSSTPVHNLGGNVAVSGTLSNFEITADAITQDICRKIASSQAGNWDKLTVNGEAVESVPTTACSEDSSGLGTNTMAFTAH